MEKLYEQICAAVREAGAIVLLATAEGKNVREKTSRHDLVTAYDARVQRFLQERLLALLPEAGFLGEEDGGRLEAASAWRFIVDPIDGTMNFIRTLRRSCISVGLAQGERMEFGAVYDPYHDELFTAVRGARAGLHRLLALLSRLHPADLCPCAEADRDLLRHPALRLGGSGAVRRGLRPRGGVF